MNCCNFHCRLWWPTLFSEIFLDYKTKFQSYSLGLEDLSSSYLLDAYVNVEGFWLQLNTNNPAQFPPMIDWVITYIIIWDIWFFSLLFLLFIHLYSEADVEIWCQIITALWDLLLNMGHLIYSSRDPKWKSHQFNLQS